MCLATWDSSTYSFFPCGICQRTSSPARRNSDRFNGAPHHDRAFLPHTYPFLARNQVSRETPRDKDGNAGPTARFQQLDAGAEHCSFRPRPIELQPTRGVPLRSNQSALIWFEPSSFQSRYPRGWVPSGSVSRETAGHAPRSGGVPDAEICVMQPLGQDSIGRPISADKELSIPRSTLRRTTSSTVKTRGTRS